MTQECLICLGPLRIQWTPDTKCDCKPTLHKKCWQKWIERGNGTCIICRSETQQEEQEEPPEPQIQQRPQPPAGFWQDYKAIYILNIVLYIIFVIATIHTVKDHFERLQKDEL